MTKNLILIFFLFLVFRIPNSFGLGLGQIYDLSDISGGTYTPGVSSGNITLVSNFCVLEASLLTGPFEIRFTSANASGTTFRVKRSVGNYYIPYSVSFYLQGNASGTEYVMSSGVRSSSFGSILTLGICFSNSMKIVFNSANLQGAGAGTYSDVLTITVYFI